MPMPRGWVYVVHIPIGGNLNVWIELGDSCYPGNHCGYVDLFPQHLYPQDERADPPFGANRGQHKKIKQRRQPWATWLGLARAKATAGGCERYASHPSSRDAR